MGPEPVHTFLLAAMTNLQTWLPDTTSVPLGARMASVGPVQVWMPPQGKGCACKGRKGKGSP